MIYQLARTSPLLSGQVKLNMILNGPKVVDLQYVPLSKYIPFNYSLPQDTLNYTYGENVRMLYNKTKDTFFKDVHNPKLSEDSLFRSPGKYFYDTHDGSYEMSMRRLEYNRYNKQFEFFCPLWCDNKEEFKNIVFYLTIANNKGRRLFRKRIDTSYVKEHFEKFVNTTSNSEDNTDLIYIDLKNCEAHIRGLNVETGNIQTVDTSYITSTLTSCERTVMETDSFIASMFSANKIVSTQLYNFSFVFNLEDFVPLYMTNDISGDFINAFVDVFVNKGTSEKENLVQCEVKDIYTNYDFIPKYDIFKTVFTDENVLDYMKDYNSVDLINKNKLTQGIFHWALKSNENEMFNLYNGFAPSNNGEHSCSGISNGITDMYTDVFDMNKNPFGLLKWKNISDITVSNMSEFITEVTNEENYYSINLSLDNLEENETQLFGNIIIDNKKLLKTMTTYNDNVGQIEKYFQNKQNINEDTTNAYLRLLADYAVYSNFSDENNNIKIFDILNAKLESTTYKDTNKIKSGLFLINKNFNLDNTQAFLPDWIVSPMECLFNNGEKQRRFSENSFIAVKFNEHTQTLFIAFLTNDFNDFFVHQIFFRSLYSFDPVAYNAHLFCTGDERYNIVIEENANLPKHLLKIEKLNKNNNTNKYTINKTIDENNRPHVYAVVKLHDIVLNAYCFLCDIIKCALLPNIVTFKKSLTTNLLKAPKILSKEVDFKRFTTNINLQRYDGNILPMFVSLNSVFYNNVYWNKQYQESIYKHITRFKYKKDPNEITKFVKLADTKFSPVYRSLGYYCLDSEKTDYETFYLDKYDENNGKMYAYDGEKSWYKSNSLVFLPVAFDYEIIKKTGEQITRADIIDCISLQIEKHYENKDKLKETVDRWICDLYQYEYTYDYVSETNIDETKYKIKFNLK